MQPYFDQNYIYTSDMKIETVPVIIQKQFRVYLPADFREDDNLSYRYTCFSQSVETPLSVAIRYASHAGDNIRQKVIRNYFEGEELPFSIRGNNGYPLYYKGNIHQGDPLSIYLLRFVLDVGDGLLMGCFSCNAASRREWQEAILFILCSIERMEQTTGKGR